MAAKYYTDVDQGVLDEAHTAAEALLDFFYQQHSRFGIDSRTANRCAAMVREVADLLGQVQIAPVTGGRARRG